MSDSGGFEMVSLQRLQIHFKNLSLLHSAHTRENVSRIVASSVFPLTRILCTATQYLWNGFLLLKISAL